MCVLQWREHRRGCDVLANQGDRGARVGVVQRPQAIEGVADDHQEDPRAEQAAGRAPGRPARYHVVGQRTEQHRDRPADQAETAAVPRALARQTEEAVQPIGGAVNEREVEEVRQDQMDGRTSDPGHRSDPRAGGDHGHDQDLGQSDNGQDFPEVRLQQLADPVPERVIDDGCHGADDAVLLALGQLMGRPQTLELRSESFNLSGFSRQFLLIRVHDPLAIRSEQAELEHVVHISHDDQILALCRDRTDVVHRGHQSQVAAFPGRRRRHLDPVLDRVDVLAHVHHQRDQDQGEATDQHVAVGPDRPLLVEPSQGRQPVGEADRHQEAGHDRVGIAEVRMPVVVLEHLREGGQSADEVHQEHPRDRVAAELVHRDDARARSFRAW